MSLALTTESLRDTASIRYPSRAVVQLSYGAPDVLHLAEVERPEVGPRDVLINVRAAGVDRGVLHLLAGTPYLLRLMGFGLRRPKNSIPGLDVAGTVVEIGSGVTSLAAGDEVFGFSRGGFAEFAVASESKLAIKPATSSFEQAAAAPVSGVTALQAVYERARVKPGDKVLIMGASGGVGSFAVQVAKHLGAEVTAVCSESKRDFVSSLGARHVLDYSRDDFADGTARYDAIIDIAGNNSIRRLRKALAPRGALVIVGGESGGNITGGIGRQLRALMLSPFVSQRLTMVVPRQTRADLERLAALIDAGDVTPQLDRTYPLDEARDALTQLAAGQVRGKLALTV